MSCPFYTFKDNDYHCLKTRKDVNSDTYYRYCRNYSYDECPVYKAESSSGGCFITSACVKAMGMEDDCYELETLRNYRDTWLKETEAGQVLVCQYYEIATKIVTAIDEKDNAKEIYAMIYTEMVKPCVELIEQGKMEEALEVYKSITLKLKVAYC